MSFNVPGLVLHADVHTQEDRRMKTQISKYLWSLAGFALITPSLSAGEVPVIEPQDRSLQADFIEAAARTRGLYNYLIQHPQQTFADQLAYLSFMGVLSQSARYLIEHIASVSYDTEIESSENDVTLRVCDFVLNSARHLINLNEEGEGFTGTLPDSSWDLDACLASTLRQSFEMSGEKLIDVCLLVTLGAKATPQDISNLTTSMDEEDQQLAKVFATISTWNLEGINHNIPVYAPGSMVYLWPQKTPTKHSRHKRSHSNNATSADTSADQADSTDFTHQNDGQNSNRRSQRAGRASSTEDHSSVEVNPSGRRGSSRNRNDYGNSFAPDSSGRNRTTGNRTRSNSNRRHPENEQPHEFEVDRRPGVDPTNDGRQQGRRRQTSDASRNSRNNDFDRNSNHATPPRNSGDHDRMRLESSGRYRDERPMRDSNSSSSRQRRDNLNHDSNGATEDFYDHGRTGNDLRQDTNRRTRKERDRKNTSRNDPKQDLERPDFDNVVLNNGRTNNGRTSNREEDISTGRRRASRGDRFNEIPDDRGHADPTRPDRTESQSRRRDDATPRQDYDPTLSDRRYPSADSTPRRNRPHPTDRFRDGTDEHDFTYGDDLARTPHRNKRGHNEEQNPHEETRHRERSDRQRTASSQLNSAPKDASMQVGLLVDGNKININGNTSISIQTGRNNWNDFSLIVDGKKVPVRNQVSFYAN